MTKIELTIKQQKERLNIFQFQFTIFIMIAQNKDSPTSPVQHSQHQPVSPQRQKPKQSDISIQRSAASKRTLQDQSLSSKENKYTGCNCTKSQCLKMYCACFSMGKICDQTCLCQSCKNDDDNMERSEAINEIITKDPFAFSRKHPVADFVESLCNCKKSFCLKKYCDCYRRGKQCGQSCQCQGCHNRDAEQKLDRQEPTKMKKVE